MLFFFNAQSCSKRIDGLAVMIVPVMTVGGAVFLLPAKSLYLTIWGVILLLLKRHRFLGTTLMPAWGWALFSMLVVGLAVGLSEHFRSETAAWYCSFRFAALVTTFCPCMAVLGARRPQFLAWQWIVFALWGVVSLPAGEAILMRPGMPLDVGGLRAWFLLILIIVPLVNWLPTRYWISAMLFAGGQTLLMFEYFPFTSGMLTPRSDTLGLVLMVVSLTIVALSRQRQQGGTAPLDRVWLDFRDGFGALWAARVAERVNATASSRGWEIRLRWHGFRPVDRACTIEPIPPEIAIEVQQTLENLLRRFVSPQWIASRVVSRVD